MTRLKIGTRGSKLALAQAYETRRRLMDAHGWEEDDLEIVVIKTTGDMIRDRPLAEIGGKGLFTKEIEEALISGRIDIAVHSMKDVPALQPEGLTLSAFLPREDCRDAFLSPVAKTLDALPEGAKVGTSSVRRAAQLLARRPDLEITGFRGNVGTRLEKLKAGAVDATFLACAGLNRLGLSAEITQAVPVDIMLPAVAQGAIGIEIREDDPDTRVLLDPLNDADTQVTVAAERGFLIELEGSCRTPLAAHATVSDDGVVSLQCEALTLDGRKVWRASRVGPARDTGEMGRDAAREVLAAAGEELVL